MRTKLRVRKETLLRLVATAAGVLIKATPAGLILAAAGCDFTAQCSA